MTSITASDLLTIIFVLVDDWYQVRGIRLLKGKPGAKPEFSNSEVITLLLAMDFIPWLQTGGDHHFQRYPCGL